MKNKYLITILVISISICINAVSALPAYSLSGAKPVSTALPTKLMGTWQVKEVHIDTKTSRTLHIQYNDPALKGRLLTISPGKIVSNISYGDQCSNAMLTTKKMTAAALLKNSMGWRMVDPEIPTPKDYELPLSGNASVEVLSMNCRDGLWGRGLGQNKGIMGAWMVALPNGRLAMRWYDESILILSRLSVDAKPQASFNCSKAGTLVEKTICGSIELASFDVSIAELYRGNLKEFSEEKNVSATKQLKACQRTWIKKRDACGTDAACLKKTMQEQMDILNNAENFNKSTTN